jgi:hypothetical protein
MVCLSHLGEGVVPWDSFCVLISFVRSSDYKKDIKYVKISNKFGY